MSTIHIGNTTDLISKQLVRKSGVVVQQIATSYQRKLGGITEGILGLV